MSAFDTYRIVDEVTGSEVYCGPASMSGPALERYFGVDESCKGDELRALWRGCQFLAADLIMGRDHRVDAAALCCSVVAC